jgi:hypothetical protein
MVNLNAPLEFDPAKNSAAISPLLQSLETSEPFIRQDPLRRRFLPPSYSLQ